MPHSRHNAGEDQVLLRVSIAKMMVIDLVDILLMAENSLYMEVLLKLTLEA